MQREPHLEQEDVRLVAQAAALGGALGGMARRRGVPGGAGGTGGTAAHSVALAAH